jgi:hypothetical protein
MTEDELKAIEARANRSTPNLQYGSVIDDDSLKKEDVVFSIAQGRVATLHGGLSLQTCDNGGFFMSARPDILALVAEVRRLQRHSEALKQLRLVQPSGTPPAVTEEVMDRIADFILGGDSDEAERRRDLREGSWDVKP